MLALPTSHWSHTYAILDSLFYASVNDNIMQADYDCAYSHRCTFIEFLDASPRQITWPEITSNQRNLFFGCFQLEQIFHRRISHRFHPMVFEQLDHFALKYKKRPFLHQNQDWDSQCSNLSSHTIIIS